VGDVVAWTSSNYNLVTFSWAPLDYINIIFYLLGGYFFAVLVRGGDIPLWQKCSLFLITLPAWFITATSQSIVEFNQPMCEAFNNTTLTTYKLLIEFFVVGFIVVLIIKNYKKSDSTKRRQMLSVGGALILFFSVFSVTEYISSQTGIYEINLYSLFVLPVFLAIIIYSVTSLKIFQLRFFGTQLLIYVLLIMVGSQFFFLQNSTDKTLTLVTFALSLTFSYFLMKTIRREAEARARIEQLAEQLEKSNLSLADANEKLKGLDKLKNEFLSLASHQLRSPLTAIKGYASMLTEGSFGSLEGKQDEAVKRIYASAQGLVNVVEDLLNVSKIEQGGMKYEFMPTDLNGLVTQLVGEMKIPAENKQLAFSADIPAYDKLMVNADPVKLKQVFLNLVDNSIKYTQTGFVHIKLFRDEDAGTITFSVTDSGVGVSPETKAKLFEKFSRGEGGKLNTGGSGLGLYLAREIARAHKGDVVIDSEGLGKGSTFSVTLPAVGGRVK
jgi:signal transduction histidine kinase